MYLSESKEFDDFIMQWLKTPLHLFDGSTVLDLNLPRRVGKTSYALKLLDQIYDSCLFVNRVSNIDHVNMCIDHGYMIDPDGKQYYTFENHTIKNKIFNANSLGIKGIQIDGLVILDDNISNYTSEFFDCLLPICSKKTKILILG